MLGISAIALDLPYGMLVGDQLQAGLDSAAHAGAMRLNGTDEGMTEAAATALAFAASHTAGGHSVVVTEADLTFGTWEDDGSFVEESDPELVNGLWITSRSDVQALASEAAFSNAVGEVNRTAAARRDLGGAGAVECFLPLALPSCLIESYGQEGVQSIDLVLNPPSVDNVGWARPFAQPTGGWLSDQITDCEQDGGVSVGDPVDINNGALTTGLHAMADAVAASTETWDESVWGTLPAQNTRSGIPASDYGATLERPVLVFDGDEYCSGDGRWNETREIIGFTWGAVFEVVTSGPVAERTLTMRLEPTIQRTFGTDTGGPDWGVQGVSGATLMR
jgi:hypothetical protein